MREGRIRPSLFNCLVDVFVNQVAAMREGRIRPSLWAAGSGGATGAGAAMREGRIRPSLGGGRFIPLGGRGRRNEGGANSPLVAAEARTNLPMGIPPQ